MRALRSRCLYALGSKVWSFEGSQSSRAVRGIPVFHDFRLPVGLAGTWILCVFYMGTFVSRTRVVFSGLFLKSLAWPIKSYHVLGGCSRTGTLPLLEGKSAKLGITLYPSFT